MPPVHNPLGEHGGIPKDFAMPPRAHYDGAKMKGSKPTADVTTSTDSFMGTGSFTALLITLTMTTVGVLIWLAYRFMKQRQRQQLKSGKSVTKKSIAQQVLNAMMRAKGVAVWLKAIRYVQNGITDDRLFKNNATAVANAHQHNNPFIQDDKDDEEDTVVGGGAHSGAGKETNLAIIICTDEPTTTTTNNNPSASTQIDAERLTQMFDHLAYFGGSYKTVTFSSKSIAPTSANIAEILVQLAASRRVWNQVVVYISAPTRAFPKDFLDSSVFRNPNSDLSTVEKFSRPVKQPKQPQGGEDADDGEAPSSSSVATTSTFVGSAGLEFLAQPEAPEDPLSWVDVALLLDRLRLVTKRRDDDAPILLLFDPVMPTGPSAAGHGVSDSVAWMHVDKFQVEFNESPAEAQQRGAKPDDEKLMISSEEMVKFLPDDDLLKELSGMPLDVLLRNALGIYESLTATVVCAENQPPRVASVKSAAASGKKKQSVASAFCEAILDGQKGQSLSMMGGGWAGAAQQVPSMGGGDAFEALLTSAPFQSGAPNNASVSEAILRTSSSSLEDTIATSLYDTGMMTSETVALHLAHYHQYHHRAVANDSASPPPPPRTFVVHSCGKGATVPPSLQPVPLATRVAMMPRPLHCRVPPTMSQLAQFLYSQVQADVNRLWLTMGGDETNGVTSPASGSKLVTVFVRENGGSACSGSTLLGKRLAWDARLLQRYTSGVVYVDLRDLFAPAALLSTSSVTDLHKQWFIDLIGYICRLVGITVQIATMEEAQDVWERVWCHSEAQYFIIFDHAPVSLACGGNSEGSLHFQSLIQLLTRVVHDAVVKSRVLIIPEGDVSSVLLSLTEKVSSLDGPRRGNAPSVDENSKAAWLGNVTESLMGRSGVHLRSETWSAIRPLVVSLVESTISKGASSLDVLPIAEYFVKRAAASHSNVLQQRRRGGDQAVVLDASSMWTMLGDVGQAELVANVEQLLFDGSTRMPILIAPATDAPVASKKAKSSNSSGAAAIIGVNAPESVVLLDRLLTLQSIVLAPLLFRHQDHPQRIALHRARLIAVMFGRLTTYRFTVALQELVRLGIVLAENSSFVSDATSQSTLLEDAHAAMVDAGIMVRVNQLLVESAAALRRTDLHKLTDVTSLHSFTELLSSASQSSASVDESQLLFAVQASLISSMMPFVHPSRRSETRNHGVYLELMSLLSTLKENSTVVKSLTPDQVIGISETVKNKMCSPWFLQSVLEQCSAARLWMLLQGTEESLKALATIWHHHVARASNDSNPVPGVDVTVIASAVSTIRKIISVMELQLDVIHRNPLELWSALYLLDNNNNNNNNNNATSGGGDDVGGMLPYFHLQKQLQDISDPVTRARELTRGIEPVLAIEPAHNATVAMEDAFDGSMLFVASRTTISVVSDSAAAKSITAGLFIARGTMVVGFSDGSFSVVAQQQQITKTDEEEEQPATNRKHNAPVPPTLWLVTRHVSADTSGHGGAPISEFMVVRSDTSVAPNTPSTIALVTCSKSNRCMRRWNIPVLVAPVEEGSDNKQLCSDDVLGLLPSTASTASPEQRHQQLRQRRVMFPETGEYGVAHQNELTTLHHFYAKIVRCTTNATVVGESHFGRDRRNEVHGFQPKQAHREGGAEAILLQYGLPDLYRGGQYNENTGDSELNSVAIAHDEGLSLCSGSFTLSRNGLGKGGDKNSASVLTHAQCGLDRRGHLVAAIAAGTSLTVLRILKETGSE